MISIIMTARERYDLTQASLSSVLKGLKSSVPIVFVAGNAPQETLAHLGGISKKRRNFTLIRENRYLWANESRKIGLKRIPKTSDVVFVENDVIVRPGWLDHLLRCSREYKADIVAPLILEGNPGEKDPLIHTAGILLEKNESGRLIKIIHHLDHQKADLKSIRTAPVDAAEFHCVFVRRPILDLVGMPHYPGTLFSHIDFSMAAKIKGAKIMLEPRSQVIFGNPKLSPFSGPSDFEFFVHRWNERACRGIIEIFANKWGLDPKGRLLWSYRKWSIWNKADVLSNFGVLNILDRLIWKAAGYKLFPEWAREKLEARSFAKLRAKFKRGLLQA